MKTAKGNPQYGLYLAEQSRRGKGRDRKAEAERRLQKVVINSGTYPNSPESCRGYSEPKRKWDCRQKCRGCNGSGKFGANAACNRCEGTGYESQD